MTRRLLGLLVTASIPALGCHCASAWSTVQPSVQRGEYLVEGIGHRFQCHSELDRTKPGFPPVEDGEGAGPHSLADDDHAANRAEPDA